MNWLDIRVKDWINIYEYLNDNDAKMVLSILYDLDFDEIEDLPYDLVIEKLNSIQFLTNPPKIKKPHLIIEGVDFYLMDFNRIEFGAFIDLEYYLTKEKNWYNNLPYILQILYRRKLKHEDLFEGDEWEPYNNFSTKRKDLFYDVLFVDVYGSLNQYLEFREKLFGTYEGMFNEKGDEIDEDTTRMTAEERKEIEQEKRIGKWSYELLLMKLSNNDPLKIGEAMKLPLTRAFNLLAMMYELKINQ